MKRNYITMKKSSNINQVEDNIFINVTKLPKLYYKNNISKNLFKYIILLLYITKLNDINKIKIPRNHFDIIPVEPDGNYLFRCISKFFSGTENYHLYIRNIIYNYVIQNKETLKNNSNYFIIIVKLSVLMNI